MKKIGLLSPFPPKEDGIAIYSSNLKQELEKRNYKIISIGDLNSKADYIIDFKSFNLKKNLEKIIRKEKIDVLHIQYVATLFGKYTFNLNLINALKISIPTIITLHEVQYSNKGLKNWILCKIEKNIINNSNIVIVHNPKQKYFLEKKHKKNNIYSIYQGLLLHPKKNKKTKNKILFFGMISPGKGVEYLIKSMKRLKNYNLTIAGKFINNKIETCIKNQLTNYSNINTDFNWITENKKELYYKNADIVVLPYIWAPYQSAIMQDAISWNLPVVVTNTGALNEMVDEFKFGEIAKLKNPRSLADSIKKVFANYSKYQKGIANYRKAANWKEVSKKTILLYKKLILNRNKC